MVDLKSKLLNLGIVIDNEYLCKYIKLIEDNKFTKREKYKTQKHHIVPKYYYKYNNLNIDNSCDNIVNLLYINHILAHYYLTKCSVGVFKSSNILAIRYILVNKSIDQLDINDINLQEYQDLYEQVRQDIYLKTHTVEINKKISSTLSGRESPVKGKHLVPIRKSLLSNKNINAKNKKLSDYACTRIGELNSFYGKRHTDETKHRISLKNSKKVGMFSIDGKLLNEFNSIKDAASYLYDSNIAKSLSVHSRICRVCRANNINNCNYIAYGYVWRYL